MMPGGLELWKVSSLFSQNIPIALSSVTVFSKYSSFMTLRNPKCSIRLTFFHLKFGFPNRSLYSFLWINFRYILDCTVSKEIKLLRSARLP